MPTYMLLLHENPNQFAGRSESEMMKVVKEYGAWATKLRSEDRLAGGEKLADEGGKILKGKNGKIVVTDGPYAEAREVIGGYFAIKAKDYAEAVKIAEDCPHLHYDGRIELRQVDEMGG